jgi:hypothetical protein
MPRKAPLLTPGRRGTRHQPSPPPSSSSLVLEQLLRVCARRAGPDPTATAAFTRNRFNRFEFVLAFPSVLDLFQMR